MSFLGLDIGTSAVKAVVISHQGEHLGEATSPLTSQHPLPGWSEQNPDSWIEAVVKCCAILKSELRQGWNSVEAIGLSGQMHGATLLGRDHRPVRPAILWNDGRSIDQCDAINQSIPDIETRAGIFAMPGFTAPKLLWCAENEPDVFKQVAHILLPKDYVRLALTGDRVTDPADAAGTLWMNQETRNWDNKLTTASKTETSWLPDIVEGTHISGKLRSQMAKRLGLKTGIPVSGGGGDAAAGALGIGAIDDGDAFISLGTSGQLFVSTENYRPAPASVIHCYAHCVPDRWFQMACMLNGASPMSWFASIANRPIDQLLKDAEKETKAPLFLPYLTGERTPHNDTHIRGAFYGLAPDTNDARCMRAVVEAIAYSFCDANDCLEKAGTSLSHVAAIGGGTRSDFVLQTMANAMKVTITRYQDSATGPALGAARTAMVAAGSHTLQEVAQKPKLDKVFEPEPNAETYHTEKRDRWRLLYATLKSFAARDRTEGKTP